METTKVWDVFQENTPSINTEEVITDAPTQVNVSNGTPLKVIYWTKEFWDLVVQVSNYGIDIVKPNENVVWWFEQLCFFSYLYPLTQFLNECMDRRNNITNNTVDIEKVSYNWIHND